MRTRLSYLAVILIPLLVYGAGVLTDFGTPADFRQMESAGKIAVAERASDGILQSALLEISFGFVHQVADLRFLRVLGLGLLILCGIALWQLLERGGWSELEAAVAAVCVLLLPTAQLSAGWATAWPGTLAALLALAGFAAVESELELGGRRRFIAVLGGFLLYLAAAMCFFPGVLMALVPLTGLALVRTPRVWVTVQRWFLAHVGVLSAAVGVAWSLEWTLQRGAGLMAASTLGERVWDVFTFALPSAWAPFLAVDGVPLRIVGALLAAVVVAAVLIGVRRLGGEDERQMKLWRLVLPVVAAVFVFVLLLSPTDRLGYRAIWPLAAVSIMAVLALLRGLTEQPGRRPVWRHAAMASVLVLGMIAASGQFHAKVAGPLADEWHALDQAVLRGNFVGQTRAQLLVKESKDDPTLPEARFGARVGGNAAAAEGALAAALRERFPSGLPSGSKLRVEVIRAGESTDRGAFVHDFSAPRS